MDRATAAILTTPRIRACIPVVSATTHWKLSACLFGHTTRHGRAGGTGCRGSAARALLGGRRALHRARGVLPAQAADSAARTAGVAPRLRPAPGPAGVPGLAQR